MDFNTTRNSIRSRSELEAVLRQVLDTATEGSKIRSDKLLNGIFAIMKCESYPGFSADLDIILSRQGLGQVLQLLPRSRPAAE